MVSLGLAKGRTKAGWAQARRPGKRDRDAAKKEPAEGLSHRVVEVGMEMEAGGGGTNTNDLWRIPTACRYLVPVTFPMIIAST